MKKTLSISALLFLLCSLQLRAVVRTVNPNNPSPGQFTTLSSAMTASANGDTIYLSGGNYTGATNGKQLVFIGTGHNPDKQSPTICSIPNIDPIPGCQGSKYIGITFTGVSAVSSALSGNLNLEYINCRFQNSSRPLQFSSASAVSGITFRGCIFTGLEPFFSVVSGMTLTLTASNCIFAPSPSSGINCLSGSSITISGTFTNCQFQHSNSILLAANASSLTVSNCVFYGVRPAFATGSNTTATNCLSFNNSNNAFSFTSQSGSLVGVNPQFANNPPTASPVFSYADNYRLGASSSGKNYGTDGKDIGVYGGTFNFTMTGEPSTIPVIRSMNLQGSTTVPAGTPINVNVISTVKF